MIKIGKKVQQLVEWYGVKEIKIVDKYSKGTNCSIKVRLIDEWAVVDEIKSIEDATEMYLVSFVTTRQSEFDRYISI